MDNKVIDERLNQIIKKYHIYEKAGIWIPLDTNNWLITGLKLVWGLLRLMWVLNRTFDEISDDNIAMCASPGKLRLVIWKLLYPRNREKIRYLISIRGDKFQERTVVENWEIKKYNLKTIFSVDWDRGEYAYLIGKGHDGNIIDICSLIYENGLADYFADKIIQNPYVDIYIAKCIGKNKLKVAERKKWHRRLIAYYLQARDFINLKHAIWDYISMDYEDIDLYKNFWGDVEQLLFDIRWKLQERNQRDIFIHWIDQVEIDDFYSMKWTGNTKTGICFTNAYTTMTNTTPVVRSIFTGKNVKTGNLKEMQRINEENSVFIHILNKKGNIQVFTRSSLRKYIDNKFVHNYHRNLSQHMPSMIGFWEAIGAALASSKPCVFFLHCMETHDPYCSGEVDDWHLSGVARGCFQLARDYTDTAKASREYLDRQLEWYYGFYPPNSVSIYMSDHGNERDLSNQNVNMPFKILGIGKMGRVEYRLFSYKNLFRLIEYLNDGDKNKYEECFSNSVIIDSIDPYNNGFMKAILKEEWNHFVLSRLKIDEKTLKKYLQTTKIVTACGEYYTINILGEETYYRDKECKINLANDSRYAKRIIELREEAGKFYNPWKEKQKVAIEFYKRLGIEEKDIIAQCY